MIRKALRFAAGTFMILAVAFAGIQLAEAQTKDFNVPAQSATTGIPEFARQAGIQILASESLVRGKRIAAVTGSHSVDEALTILLKGTGLVATSKDGATYTVAAAPAPSGLRNSTPPAGVLTASQSPSENPPNTTVPVSESKEAEKPKLEEIIVTGSRIPTTKGESAQEVKVYTSEQIERSGQTTVSDFLNTLPEVSLSMNEQSPGINTPVGVTTVTLRGLPIGTTLVLVNGRRVETSGVTQGGTGNIFDLNLIPLAAVDRIEVISEGSSAVYGSDAIAGVVNIILKSHVDGIELNAKYGGASDTDQWNGDLALGKTWSSGSISLIGSALSRGELVGTDRALTATDDFTPFGGQDTRQAECNPGNVLSVNASPLPGLGTATLAAVPAGFTGQPTREEFLPTAGTVNKCGLGAYGSLIPPTDRQSALVLGNYDVSPSTELFTELMFSHVYEVAYSAPPGLFAVPGYTQFTASASNPYNPFGETVGVGDLFTSLPRSSESNEENFIRALVGTRGHFSDDWYWEVAGWDTQDRAHTAFLDQINSTAAQNALNSSNPATALNPFVAGPPGSQQLLQSLLVDQPIESLGRIMAVNGFVRGPVFNLPAGPAQVVFGGEYDHEQLDQTAAFASISTSFHRNQYAIFSEAKVPIFGNATDPRAGEQLTATLAGRFDDYQDVGHKTTPQYGLEWRPIQTLLIRGTYGGSFKAPALYQLDGATFSSPTVIADPLRGGQQEEVNAVFGSNPNLKPETGLSRTIGFVYTSDFLPGLRLSLTQWSINESNSIQALSVQALVNNASLFPGAVIRPSSCSGAPPCPITQINATEVNFGNIDVAGIDIRASYTLPTQFGEVVPSVGVAETYRYTVQLTPNVPAMESVSQANDDNNWAPRWKAVASLGWKTVLYRLTVDGRYVGHYLDYQDIPNFNELGNFWLCDANFRYDVGQALGPTNRALKGTYVEIGGVNVFNRLPQYSNYQYGSVGYDPQQADIRGRFLYVEAGARW